MSENYERGQRSSIIHEVVRDDVAILRKSYVAICEGDHCAALVLAQLARLQEQNIDAGKPLEFRCTAESLSAALMCEYGVRRVRTAKQHIERLGFVTVRSCEQGYLGDWHSIQVEHLNAALLTYEHERDASPSPEAATTTQVGPFTRIKVFIRDKFTCRYCGGRPPEVRLEVDHVHPKSRGGTDDFDNLVTACADCNRGKGPHTLAEIGAAQ